VGATLIDEHQSLVGSTTPSTITLQAALKNSSRSAADLPLFSWWRSSALWLGIRGSD
jgi:hypothetical protein